MLAALLLSALPFAAAGPSPVVQEADEFESQRQAAEEAYRRGDYERAIEHYHQSFGPDTADWSRVYNLACCYGLAGRPGEALSSLEQAVLVCFSYQRGSTGDLKRLLGLLYEDPDLESVRAAPETSTELVRIIDGLEHFLYQDTRSALELARRRLADEQPELAYRWLETAVDASWGAQWLQRLVGSDPQLKPLWQARVRDIVPHARERYAELLDSSRPPASWIDWVDGHRDVVMSLDVRPDGKQFVSTGRDRTARIWDLDSLQARVTLRGHVNFVLSARFSPSGERVATACVDRTARIWDARSGQLIQAFGPGSILQDAEFSPDGRRLVTAGMEDRLAHVWDVDSGELLLTLEGARSGVWTAVFSPDGELIATGSLDSDVRVYEAASGKLLWTWEQPEYTVRRVEFSPDGEQVLVTSYDGALRLYETAPDARPVVFSEPGHNWLAAKFDTSGETFVAASDTGRCFLWDVHSRELIRTLSTDPHWLMDVDFTPDGDQVLAAAWDRGILRWDARSGEPLTGVEHRQAGIASAAFSPQGDRLVTLGPGGALEWSLTEGVVVPPRGAVRHAGGDPTLAGPLPWRSPRSYDWSGQTPAEAPPAPADALESYLAPDGAATYAIGEDGRGALWSGAAGGASVVLADAHVRAHPEEPWQREIHKAAFSPDGSVLATVFHGDSRARLWDARSGERLQILRGHGDEVIGVAFAPDGERLLTTSRDGTARVWEVATGRQELLLGPLTREITCGAFSPDGALIATGDFDASVRLWDATSGVQTAELRAHTRPVLGVAFSPDSLRLASTSLDETTRLWDLLTDELLVSLVDFGEGEWLSFTPQLYFASSDEAARRASLSLGAEPYPLTCFASLLRKPDSVRKSLDGFPEATVTPPTPPDLVVLAPTESDYTSSERTVRLNLRGSDLLGVDRLEVVQDGRPMEAEALRGALQREPGREERAELALVVPIPEGPDATEVVVRAVNSRGILSREQRITLRYEAPTAELYLLALGVWNYAESSLDLQSPGKDVAGITDFFAGQEGGLYDKVHVHQLLNEEVSTSELRRQRDNFLLKAGPDDTIVVFVAGHAVRSAAADEYYFLTPAATPDDPYEGVPRENLENLVAWDRLQARKRVMFLDTCHAGSDDLTTRGRGVDFMNDARVVDLTKKSQGLYILAASTSMESAREEEDNGLFTWALLHGLSGAADSDQSGYVEVEELLQFVREEVREKTGGAQTPVLASGTGESFRLAGKPN